MAAQNEPKVPSLDRERILRELNEDGISIIESLVSEETLDEMSEAFAAKLERQRFNDVDGYEKTERYRRMVQDVLLLSQGFVDAPLHPDLQAVLREYIGADYTLAEAKGWESLACKRDFHAWHGDAWYDQNLVTEIPKEVKLAVYLTDVQSGYFCYIKKTHRKFHPRNYRPHEAAHYPASDILEVPGKRGTAVLFDTSGIHRQGTPILEPRRAIFYAYHGPSVPLQQEDTEYNRYHPLLLNAALLGNLDEESMRVLGFGDKTHWHNGVSVPRKHKGFQNVVQTAHQLLLLRDDIRARVASRLQRQFRFGRKKNP